MYEIKVNGSQVEMCTKSQSNDGNLFKVPISYEPGISSLRSYKQGDATRTAANWTQTLSMYQLQVMDKFQNPEECYGHLGHFSKVLKVFQSYFRPKGYFSYFLGFRNILLGFKDIPVIFESVRVILVILKC